jgi:hypothetical protein
VVGHRKALWRVVRTLVALAWLMTVTMFGACFADDRHSSGLALFPFLMLFVGALRLPEAGDRWSWFFIYGCLGGGAMSGLFLNPRELQTPQMSDAAAITIASLTVIGVTLLTGAVCGAVAKLTIESSGDTAEPERDVRL